MKVAVDTTKAHSGVLVLPEKPHQAATSDATITAGQTPYAIARRARARCARPHTPILAGPSKWTQVDRVGRTLVSIRVRPRTSW